VEGRLEVPEIYTAETLMMRTETVDEREGEKALGESSSRSWACLLERRCMGHNEGGRRSRGYLSIAKGDRRRDCDNGVFRSNRSQGIA
jgi:hypothetical protein